MSYPDRPRERSISEALLGPTGGEPDDSRLVGCICPCHSDPLQSVHETCVVCMEVLRDDAEFEAGKRDQAEAALAVRPTGGEQEFLDKAARKALQGMLASGGIDAIENPAKAAAWAWDFSQALLDERQKRFGGRR